MVKGLPLGSAMSHVSPRCCSTWSATLSNSQTRARYASRPMQRMAASLWSVSNSGSGIPDEERQRIFDKFLPNKTALAPRPRVARDSDWRLPRRLSEIHGGRIWVESIAGRGSTFRMELPVGAQASGAAA